MFVLSPRVTSEISKAPIGKRIDSSVLFPNGGHVPMGLWGFGLPFPVCRVRPYTQTIWVGLASKSNSCWGIKVMKYPPQIFVLRGLYVVTSEGACPHFGTPAEP